MSRVSHTKKQINIHHKIVYSKSIHKPGKSSSYLHVEHEEGGYSV